MTSCRKEEMELIEAPSDEALVANSLIVNLMQQVSSNDGSNDNIIDKSNCFNIKYPLKVTVNGQQINVKSEDEYKVIEYIFDDNDDDVDVLDITFPVTIVLEDFTEVIINNYIEFNSYSANCPGENQVDNDIECLDFQYPIIASIFNKSTEITNINAITTDAELNHFLKDLGDDLIVTINFPVNVMLIDNSIMSINNLSELENTINNYKNDCDEDDDYDYNDDDCDDCNIEKLTTTLINCKGWTVDQLDRNNTNYDDVYEGYTFNFLADGRVGAYWSGFSAYGSWDASGTKNNIKITINIPDLPLCNNDWILHEISEYTKTRLDLRVADADRLRYNNVCN
ncbi:hypothetical protein [uncultured Algibacter sp.]|uniref:hypothetical protein n=1 Tax=uncultured Algibacter sp. TaxID=298659 RepID=UPI002616BA1E|nr:hypothetical protein [uncultured Algibacter sp.]